ncbi:hypothetical protein K5X82_02270 [Halosquirtibacter xylanolyticus]|uniref:hypothetical protein n=1 Tax=Halosquirtibacter xylanolyticus TaxID=3374599 RepID=UPI003748B236|nr:hypothetical protein K5X82_02270 [Prolixibacteraceae bacterium]
MNLLFAISSYAKQSSYLFMPSSVSASGLTGTSSYLCPWFIHDSSMVCPSISGVSMPEPWTNHGQNMDKGGSRYLAGIWFGLCKTLQFYPALRLLCIT